MTIRIQKAFGVSGDQTSVPTDAAGTEVSFDTGWSAAYELAPTSPGYRYIDRAQHNYLWNATTGNIKLWQENLYPDYFTPAQNGGVAIEYSKGMIVNNAGATRISLVDNNTQDPTGVNWADAFPLPVALGGTGAEDAANARTNLGLGDAATRTVGTADNNLPNSGIVFGVNQTLQDLTSSRNQSQVYTNTTGKPIAVYITSVNTTSNKQLVIDPSGTPMIVWSIDTVDATVSTIFAIVLPGQEYEARNIGATGFVWHEMR